MMHIFDYTDIPDGLRCDEILRLLGRIYEQKGRTSVQRTAAPALVDALCEVARIRSTDASNRIEGIVTTAPRLRELMQQKTAPRNRSEKEIVGYRNVLVTIHENFSYISPTTNMILQLHRDLYAYSGGGGSWKFSDNVIAETDGSGRRSVRFEPVPAYRTPEAMEQMCAAFQVAMTAGKTDPLLLIPCFVLDFLCIHPFRDGNGRMSRLLTTLLLYRSGFDVGRYISLEMLIDSTKSDYYKTLQSSSVGWHENKSDYLPFVRYFLGILNKAYDDLEQRLQSATQPGISKSERIRHLFDNSLGALRKADIADQCPDISRITIERTLRALLVDGYITRLGKGRATAYIRAERL